MYSSCPFKGKDAEKIVSQYYIRYLQENYIRLLLFSETGWHLRLKTSRISDLWKTLF